MEFLGGHGGGLRRFRLVGVRAAVQARAQVGLMVFLHSVGPGQVRIDCICNIFITVIAMRNALRDSNNDYGTQNFQILTVANINFRASFFVNQSHNIL
ncbi:MAG: hypothetical protein V4857_24475 [Pseudomonadota bacterium]